MEYAIYEGFYPEVEKKLKRIERKCAAHNCAFHFEVKGEEIRDVYPVDEYGVENRRKPPYKCKFILIEVAGTARVDDWECIAVMEHTQHGNIIRKINTEMEVPERFYHSDDVCEHCGTMRTRKELFVIHNVKTDEWKQVGKSCLKLYTGGLSAEAVAAYLDGIRFLTGKSTERFGLSDNIRYFKVEDVIGYAVEVIAAYGRYVKTDEDGGGTKNMVAVMLRRDDLSERIYVLNKYHSTRTVSFSEKQFDLDSTSEKVEKIIAYYKSVEPDGEFLHNIQTTLANGYVSRKNIGFVCYLPEGYRRAMEKAEAQKAREKAHEECVAKSEFFGEVGKRYTRKIESVECLTSWETQYGYTSIYRINCDGCSLIWKTSSGSLIPCHGEVLDEITFSVKAHNEYRGEKQTEVTRCRVTTRKKEMPKDDGTFSLDVLDDLDED